MRGTYRFYQGGELIGEHSNLITTAGKKALLEYAAGYTKRLVGSLLVGVGATAANVADVKLNFEVARQPVTNASVDYANSAVVFKTQLPSPDEYTIYEVGAHSGGAESAAGASQLLFNMDANTDTWSSGTWVATNSRLGSALQITAGASTTTTSTLTGLSLDLSQYSALDQFIFAVRANNAFVSNVTFRFVTSSGNYYSASTGALSSGVYTIITANKGAFTATGTPNWANITEVHILVTATAGGTASVDIDGIRVEDVDANREESVLVSRAVLGAPVVKAVGLPLDIEYAITL